MAGLRVTTKITLHRVPGGVRGLMGTADCNWCLIFMSSDMRMKLAFQEGGALD